MGKYGRTLTFRVSAPLDRRLRAEAERLQLTPSEMAREILEEGLAVPRPTRTLAELAGNLIGSVNSSRIPHGRDVRQVMNAVAKKKRTAHSRRHG